MPSSKANKAVAAAGGKENEVAVPNELARLAALQNISLQNFSYEDLIMFLISKIPYLKAFESVWCLSGAQILAFPPATFVQNLQREFLSFPFSVGSQVFRVLQEKIAVDYERAISSKEPFDLSVEFLRDWASTSVPVEVLAPPGNFSSPSQLVDPVVASRVEPTNLTPLFTPSLFSKASFESQNQFQNPSKKFIIGGPRRVLQDSQNPNLFAESPVPLFQNSNLLPRNSTSEILQRYPNLSTNLFNQSSCQKAASAVPLPDFNGQKVSSDSQLPESLTTASAVPLPQHFGQKAEFSAQLPINNPFGQKAASAVPNHFIFGQTAASAAPYHTPFGQKAASAVPNHSIFGQTAASAAPYHSPLFGQKAASAAQYQSSATPLHFSPFHQAEEYQILTLLQNPLVSQMLQTVQSQARPMRPMLPWEALAKLHPSFVQDPSMPKGYKRMSVAKVIQAAKTRRGSMPAYVDTAKAIKWPVMVRFDKEEFVRTRKDYFEAVEASTCSGLFNTFKSCLSATTRNTATMHFQLTQDRFIDLDDDVFMHWCALHFGPGNKKEAIRLLKSVKIFHSDAKHQDSEFVQKFDQVCYDHEMAVNDIVDSQEKWPWDEDDIECAGLTAKEIAKEWKELFAKQEGRVFSHQIKKCRTFIDQNPEMPFNEQIFKLRSYFVKKNQEDILEKSEREASSYKVGGDGNAGGGVQSHSKFPKRTVTISSLSNGGGVKRDRSSGGLKAKFANQIVAGKDRGIACGSLNNHMGLGCSKNTCPVVGTDFDKSRNKAHVWKSSDMEESVTLPNDLWNERLKDNPKIIENWKKARKSIKDKKHAVKVSALKASQKDEDEDDEEEFDQQDVNEIHEDEEELDSESDEDDDEVNSTNYCVQACALNAGRASLSDPFEELGHEDQFYAVGRFAKNDDFVFKTLMDPGATINVICPQVANRAALQRRQLAVNIFQGKRKQGSVEEMVQCAFELMGADGKFVHHVEWFAVCDLGYDVLLGRRFCRSNDFTSFDIKLRKFSDLPARPGALSVATLNVTEQRVLVRFDRVEAPVGKARFKRKAKAVTPIVRVLESFYFMQRIRYRHYWWWTRKSRMIGTSFCCSSQSTRLTEKGQLSASCGFK
jgi:hypothetical protein